MNGFTLSQRKIYSKLKEGGVMDMFEQKFEELKRVEEVCIYL